MEMLRKLSVVAGVCMMLGSAACVSQIISVGEYTNLMIGQPVDDLKERMNRPNSYASRIGWKERVVQLPDDKFIFTQPIRKDCLIHWEINRERLIVSYRAEGKSCY